MNHRITARPDPHAERAATFPGLFAHRIAGRVALATAALALASPALASREVRLEHLGRYNHQLVGRDHLIGVLPIHEHYAVTCSFDALRVIDLASLPSGEGSGAFVSELRGHDVASLVKLDDTYIVANVRLGGFGIVRIDPTTMAIQWLKTVAEPGVYYEGMAVDGNRLFVAAHAYGLRAYDLAVPTNPVLLGSLTDGLDDAFAVAVAGNVAYVADGAGGLKIVDVTNPAAMRVLAGERVDGRAIGTAEDVMVDGANVYVAAGSAGVLTYERGTLARRRQFETQGIAKALTKVGGWVAVADVGDVAIMKSEPNGALPLVGSEGGLRRLMPDGSLSLRLWHGVASWGADRVVTANWDSVDVYRIVPGPASTPPDATLSNQRLRFDVAGGTITITLKNQGGSALHVSSIASGAANFSVDPKGPFTLQPDQTVDLAVSYVPGAATQTLLVVNSDDPDEAKLPVELFGDTPFLDPGQQATPFTLPMWTYDHARDQFNTSTFALGDQVGKVVYFQVFGTWCPACLPVIADMQNSLGAIYENHPQVVVALMSQKETAALLQEYWRNVYLRMPLLFDLPGNVSFIAYAQPLSGLPFSRGFLLAPDQTIVGTYFGFNADRVIDAIRRQLAPIAIEGDANLDGHVDAADFDAVRAAWGPCAEPGFCPEDVDHSGTVDEHDLEVVRAHTGASAG
ncbi:MAG: hypothetical protein U0572_14275 [Phycisphaerales bacterium]